MPNLMPQRNIPVKHKNSCEAIDVDAALRDLREMQQLAAVRKRLGYSQSDLGEAIGYEQGAISKIETGKMPITIEKLRLAADFLGVNVHDLIEDTGDIPDLAGVIDDFCSLPPHMQKVAAEQLRSLRAALEQEREETQ